jgi:hypothetical protein
MESSSNHLKSYGCVLGALIGDSIGSFFEFIPLPYDKNLITFAMSMPGGGQHKIAPG